MEHKSINRQHSLITSSSMGFSTGVGYSNTTKPNLSSLPPHSTSIHDSIPYQVGSSNRKQLSQAEYQDRRAKNLCFFCDAQYKPGHNCKRGQAFIIEAVDEMKDSKQENGSSPNEHYAIPSSSYDVDTPLISLF